MGSILAPAPDVLGHSARAWGLGVGHLQEIHRTYLRTLAKAAMADVVLSRAEHDALVLFATLLGVDRQYVLDEIANAWPADP